MSDLPPPPPPPYPPPGGSFHGDPPTGPPPVPGRSRRLMVGLVVLVLVVAAAGGAFLMAGDGGNEELPPLPELSADEQEYADALAQVAQDHQRAGEDEAACVGAAIVEVVGVDALREAAAPENLDAGLTMIRIFGVELPDDEVRELGRRLDRCVDAVEFLVAGVAPREVKQCIRTNVSEDDVAYALAASYVGSDETFQTTDDDLRAKAGRCVPGLNQD